MKSHIKSVHEGKKGYKCTICDASFYASNGLKYHMTKIHEDKRPYIYEICDSSFVLKGHLTRHISSVHEKHKPYKCDICDVAKYSRNSEIKSHIHSNSSRRKEKL